MDLTTADNEFGNINQEDLNKVETSLKHLGNWFVPDVNISALRYSKL